MRTNNLPTRAASVSNEIRTHRSSRLARLTRRPALALTAAALLHLTAIPVAASSGFRRGDADSDGTVSLSDALVTVKHLFSGGARPTCPDAADTDDNGRIDITDAISTLGFLFLGSVAPPAPGPFECGGDPTPDALGPCRSEVCPSVPGGEIIEFDSSVLHLQEDRTAEVTSSLVTSQIRDALETILNTPGDTVTLRLEGAFNVAIVPGVPIGVEVTHEPTVTLRDDGVFEVAISLETAMSLGIEIVDGIEASIAASRSGAVIFSFKDIDATIAAVQGILAGEILAPLAGAAADGLAAVEFATRALENALSDLAAAKAIEAERRKVRDAAVATVTAIQNEISKVESALSAAQSKVDDLADKVANAFADFVCKVLGDCDAANEIKKKYNDAKAYRDSLFSSLSSLKNQLISAQNARYAADVALNAAIAAVQGLESTVASLQSAFKAAAAKAAAWKQVLESLDSGRRNLEVHLSAIELHAGTEASIEAFLSPFPGVTLEGAGIGASASAATEIALRLELTTDVSIERLILSVESKGELKVKAALGVGVEGTAVLKLGAEVGFVPTSRWFKLESRSMALGLDLSAVAILGVGATLQHGAGRELEVELDLAQLDDVAPALWELVTQGDVENLATVLIGIDAPTFSAQDRWIAAAVVKAGGSYVGYGAELGGAAVWEDRGRKVEETLSAGNVVTKLFGEEAVSDALELLADATRR